MLRDRSDLKQEQLERTRQLMTAHVGDAQVSNFDNLIPALSLPDPGDCHVLAAARERSTTPVRCLPGKQPPGHWMLPPPLPTEPPRASPARMLSPWLTAASMRLRGRSQKTPLAPTRGNRSRSPAGGLRFNVGAGALAESTLRRRLNGGEPVGWLQEELPRWVKGPNGPVVALVQRRRAELAFSKESSHTIRYGEGGAIELRVPYFAQGDSATTQGPRMCFSSTCAMAAAFLRPGCLAGEGQPDDRYLALVQRYGDSTEAQAQVKALERLGIQAELRTDGRIEQLIAQLRLGIPVPVGWLHKGPVQRADAPMLKTLNHQLL